MRILEQCRRSELRAIVRTTMLFLAATGSFSAVRGSPATTQSQTPPQERAYHNLLALAEAYNADGRSIDAWEMTTEHCFLVPVSPADTFSPERAVPVLQNEVADFVDRPGTPRFLFDRLLKAQGDDTEVLVLAEFLMFATYDGNDGDFKDCSGVAARVLAAAEAGDFSAAEKRCPAAPLRTCIEAAARRAVAQSAAGSPTTQAGNGTR